MTRKGVLFDMNMKRTYEWCCCMMLGCIKVCLYTLKKEFELRFGVKKSERTTKAVLLKFFRKQDEHWNKTGNNRPGKKF